ncbi:MAG: DUF3141 domain-containing protein, partial [Pseudomonadota bacterium]
RIVYLTNPHVGHLGIFVSARVARLEHRAILESLMEIGELPPGLYEMKIDNPTGDPDCKKPQYSVRFEEREIGDLQYAKHRAEFERVRHVSELNERLYRSFVSPWVTTMTTPWTAEALRWLHPMRTSRYAFSSRFNPWMLGIGAMAAGLASHRTALASSHPWLERERAALTQFGEFLGQLRELRDAAQERAFQGIFSRPGDPEGRDA